MTASEPNAAVLPADENRRWRLYDNAPLLLVLAMTFWAGNGVVGKWVALGSGMPPVALAFWRWTMAMALILPLALPHIRRDWPAIRAKWRSVLLLAFFGIAVFNTMVYWGQYHTTAINMFLLNSMVPLLIPAISLLVFRDMISLRQGGAILLAMLGAICIIAKGDLEHIVGLSVNSGDLIIFAAMICYAIYSTCLRLKPQTHPTSFLLVIFGLGVTMLLPLYIWEHLYVAQIEWTEKSMIAVGYVGIFPSFLAYICFNRGVELMGANRASPYFHLIPLIGAILSVFIFSEALHTYHAVGAGLIIGGILISSKMPRRRRGETGG